MMDRSICKGCDKPRIQYKCKISECRNFDKRNEEIFTFPVVLIPFYVLYSKKIKIINKFPVRKILLCFWQRYCKIKLILNTKGD